MNPEEDSNSATNNVPQPMNDQITDAVTQSNDKIIAEDPAIALGNLYQTIAQATGDMFENALDSQNQQNILEQAATIQGIMQIYNVDTVADAIIIAQAQNQNKTNN